MTKTEKIAAERLATEMDKYNKKQWATFNRLFSSSVAIAAKLEIQKAAYKIYLTTTTEKMVEAGGHTAQVTEKAGASYIDYTAMLVELAEQGINTEELIKRHTKRKPGVIAFSFK